MVKISVSMVGWLTNTSNSPQPWEEEHADKRIAGHADASCFRHSRSLDWDGLHCMHDRLGLWLIVPKTTRLFSIRNRQGSDNWEILQSLQRGHEPTMIVDKCYLEESSGKVESLAVSRSGGRERGPKIKKGVGILSFKEGTTGPRNHGTKDKHSLHPSLESPHQCLHHRA